MTWAKTPTRVQVMVNLPVADGFVLLGNVGSPSTPSPYILVAFGAYMVGVFLLG